MRVSVIINPIAGLWRRPDQGRRRAELARAVFAEARVEADVRLTEYGAMRARSPRRPSRAAPTWSTRGAAMGP